MTRATPNVSTASISDERVKLYSANPPDVLRVDEKHLREYYVFNVLGLLITDTPYSSLRSFS